MYSLEAIILEGLWPPLTPRFLHLCVGSVFSSSSIKTWTQSTVKYGFLRLLGYPSEQHKFVLLTAHSRDQSTFNIKNFSLFHNAPSCSELWNTTGKHLPPFTFCRTMIVHHIVSTSFQLPWKLSGKVLDSSEKKKAITLTLTLTCTLSPNR